MTPKQKIWKQLTQIERDFVTEMTDYGVKSIRVYRNDGSVFIWSELVELENGNK